MRTNCLRCARAQQIKGYKVCRECYRLLWGVLINNLSAELELTDAQTEKLVKITDEMDTVLTGAEESGMEMDFDLIGVCDEIWVFGIDNPSEGMRKEILWAEDTSVPVLDGFEMIGESKKKSTISDASDNELVEEMLSRIRDGRIEIFTEVRQGGSSVHFEVRK